MTRIRFCREMPFDHDGMHATGREVLKPVEDRFCWFAEYEGDDTCSLPTTDPVEGEVDLAGLTVGEAVRKYIDLRKAVLPPSTQQSYSIIYRTHFMESCFGALKVSDVTSEKVQRFISDLAVRQKTVECIYKLLAASMLMLHPDAFFHVVIAYKKYLLSFYEKIFNNASIPDNIVSAEVFVRNPEGGIDAVKIDPDIARETLERWYRRIKLDVCDTIKKDIKRQHKE